MCLLGNVVRGFAQTWRTHYCIILNYCFQSNVARHMEWFFVSSFTFISEQFFDFASGKVIALAAARAIWNDKISLVLWSFVVGTAKRVLKSTWLPGLEMIQVHLFMQEHEKRKPWRVIIHNKYQLTMIYTKCWLSLSHWDESILLSHHICIKSQQLMSRITNVKGT